MSYSKFQPFTLTLPNSATLTGRSYIPRSLDPATTIRGRPLLILLHGGGCHSGYYDVDDDHTSLSTAAALGLPVICINRPCYMSTTSLFPLPLNSTFHKETGHWYNQYIFPTLWQTFGLPNDCTAIVAMAHSMAVPGLIVAASLHAEDDHPAYPLAGLIICGWGCRPNEDSQEIWLRWSDAEREEKRHLIMLSDPKDHTCDSSIRNSVAAQTVGSPAEEAEEGVGAWREYFPDYAAKINVPIMYGVGEYDWLWEGTLKHVEEFLRFFKKCTRFEGVVVLGAPHAIEWSHYAAGWYARCFGFAVEVTIYLSVQEEKMK